MVHARQVSRNAQVVKIRTLQPRGGPGDLHPLDDALRHLLGVAEQHHRVVAIEERVVDAGVARLRSTQHIVETFFPTRHS